MPKNIVVCCDGTGNEFGPSNSNIIKLYQVLDLATPSLQVAYYHPGLGTMGAPSALTKFSKWWTRLFGLAFGRGLMEDIGDAYAFLMGVYEPGDKIFLFGFSRGAYTARALAGMIYMYGLLRDGNLALIRYVTRMFRLCGRGSGDLARQFNAMFSVRCPAHFLGVWDTVSSVGWFRPIRLPHTYRNPDVSVFRQALSIDERRCYFWQNLWTDQPPPHQDVKQVWFAGVHSDIGGGYPEPQSGLAKITLQWMLREARAAGLLINAAREADVMGAGGGYAKPDPSAVSHESLHGIWWLAEILPRTHWDKATNQTSWIIPRAQRRVIPPGSFIHESVPERQKRVVGYAPPNLPAAFSIVP